MSLTYCPDKGSNSTLVKAYSPTLEDRTYISVPNNQIRSNKPIDIGYELSFINLCAGSNQWSLPLSIERVKPDRTASECARAQLAELFAHPQLGLGDQLVLNTLDSSYGAVPYLCPSYGYEQLVSIVRLRSGMKVWKQQHRSHTGGAKGYYGDKYYLRFHSGTRQYKCHPKTKKPYEVFEPSIFELPTDPPCEFNIILKNGLEVQVQLWRWKDMLLQSKYGFSAKDKPLDLLAVSLTNLQTGQRVFDNEMFLAIWGQQKEKLATQEAYQVYRHRSEIEPFFRFAKQKLLLDKCQTPKLTHLQAWTRVVQLATWLLYTAATEVEHQYRKWEKYLPINKEPLKHKRLSLAQTRRAAQRLFLTFDLRPFKPPKSKKGKGRQKGQKQIQRTRYPVRKKNNKKAKIALNTQQNE